MPLARRPSPPSLCLAPRASNSRSNALCCRAGPCFAKAAQGRLPPYEAEFTRTLAELAPHGLSLLAVTLHSPDPRVPQGHRVSPCPVRAPARDPVKPSRPPQAEGCRRHDQADALPVCAVCVAPGLNPCRPPGWAVVTALRARSLAPRSLLHPHTATSTWLRVLRADSALSAIPRAPPRTEHAGRRTRSAQTLPLVAAKPCDWHSSACQAGCR